MKKLPPQIPIMILLLIGLSILYLWNDIRTLFTQSPNILSAARLTGPLDIYPQSDMTPGTTNPLITQSTIFQTICNPHWSTSTIRPSVSYTNKLKVQQIKEYDLTDTNLSDYEEDHLISLELGGNPTDPQNLWPEPYVASVQDGGAKSKDTVENYLHKEVCSGQINLQEAQKEISTDWYAVYKQIEKNTTNLGALQNISDVDNDDN